VSECKSPAAGQSFEAPQVKFLARHKLECDWTRSEWQQVDLLEFLATTIDLRVVLFHADDPCFPASASSRGSNLCLQYSALSHSQ